MVTTATSTASPGIGSSPSDSFIITSPSLSASSLSSSGFDFVAVQQHLEQGRGRNPSHNDSSGSGGNARPHEGEPFSDDDEIVWSVSESELDIAGPLSDDDFVVLGRTGNATGSKPGTGTVRGAAVMRTGTTAGKTGNALSGSEGSMDVALDLVKVAAAMEKTALVSADLAAGLAKLSVGVGHMSDTGGTRTPIRNKPAAEQGAAKKKLKAKKLKKKEEKEKDKKKKKAKSREKGREDLMHSDSERTFLDQQVFATPMARETPLPPALPMAPLLSKSISAATLVPSTTFTGLDSAPSQAQEIYDLAPAVPPSPPPSLGDSPETPTAPLKSLKGRKKQKKGKAATTALALARDDEDNNPFQQPEDIVDESEHTQEPTAYDEAVSYITSYISNPSAHKDRVCHLTLLQSLIIELGLLTDLSLLPRTIRSAKKFLKSRVFLNVKEYLMKRNQGPAVLRELLFSSRSALIKSMRRKKSFAPLEWVKKRGLQDLLVTAFHH